MQDERYHNRNDRVALHPFLYNLMVPYFKFEEEF